MLRVYDDEEGSADAERLLWEEQFTIHPPLRFSPGNEVNLKQSLSPYVDIVLTCHMDPESEKTSTKVSRMAFHIPRHLLNK